VGIEFQYGRTLDIVGNIKRDIFVVGVCHDCLMDVWDIPFPAFFHLERDGFDPVDIVWWNTQIVCVKGQFLAIVGANVQNTRNLDAIQYIFYGLWVKKHFCFKMLFF
jgi:hypothetical protein